MPSPVGACPNCGDKGPLGGPCARPDCLALRMRCVSLPGVAGNIEARAAAREREEEAERAARVQELDEIAATGDTLQGVALGDALQPGYDEARLKVRRNQFRRVVLGASAAVIGCIALIMLTFQSSAAEQIVNACERGEGDACLAAGDALRGDGPVTLPAKAQYEMACERGVPKGCYWVARYHETSGQASRAAAEAQYRIACNARIGAACYRLAKGMERDPARVPERHRAFIAGCMAGHGDACLEAFRLQPDSSDRTMLARGCRNDHVGCCAEHARQDGV